MSATAALLGVDLARLDALALIAEPGAQGITLLPYLDGERTPNKPLGTGVLRGLTTRNAGPENLARAAIEPVLASLAEASAWPSVRRGRQPGRCPAAGNRPTGRPGLPGCTRARPSRRYGSGMRRYATRLRAGPRQAASQDPHRLARSRAD
jgi:hypothetical protein